MGVPISREAAEEDIEGDPFSLNGLVRGKWPIREWAKMLASSIPSDPGIDSRREEAPILPNVRQDGRFFS